MNDQWVERYRKEILPKIVESLSPRRVLLFGSRAAGDARPESDLDVIIVADTFASIPFVRRMAYVLGIARFPKHVDYLCYTPDEFARIQDTSSVVRDAMDHYAELTA